MDDACRHCRSRESLGEQGPGRLICSDCASELNLASEGAGLYFLLFYLVSGISWVVIAVALLVVGGPLRAVVFGCLLVPSWILWWVVDRAGVLEGFIWLRRRSPRSWWGRLGTLEYAVLGFAGLWLGLAEALAVARLV